MDRRKFITSCVCCACASAGAVLLNNSFVPQNSNNFKIQHMEMHINEHCNLKCKYCGHFSCIAQKEFYDLDKFKQDTKQMSLFFENQLLTLHLLGGEPLLNPDINKYVEITRQYFPKAMISIYTNATLLDDMGKDFWETLNKNNINIRPSIYPVEINWKSVLAKAKKYDVKICGSLQKNEIITLENIEKFRIKTFYKLKFDEHEGSSVSEILKCVPKLNPCTMYDGKIYPCAETAYIRHLNKKFNTKFIVSEGDYLDLYKIKSQKDIRKFEQTQVFPFCRKHCKQITGEIKWERADEHFLSEWT